MIFNSLEFGIFLPAVFLLYWFVVNKNIHHQNILLVISSYIFYGWWDWRFLLLMAFSSLVDYFFSLELVKEKNTARRKTLLWICLGINLSVLFFFKYFNFFIDSFSSAFVFFGHHVEPRRLSIVLPVGISFYTFQTMSYTIDVYRGTIKPARGIIAFMGFVSFFPQLVAGPIERAKNLLPQFFRERKFVYQDVVDGVRQMLWGFFKKMVVADNCAIVVNKLFGDGLHVSGSTILFGMFFYSFQLYGDFSGYSDIAIGSARLFGFRLSKNFNFPYFARSISGFWSRWHISLTRWFRDYVYQPLFGGKKNKLLQVRNTFLLFILIGLWHGASWNFVVYGIVQGLLFIPFILYKNISLVSRISKIKGNALRVILDRALILKTFSIQLLAGIFFRSKNISQAFTFFAAIFSGSLFTKPGYVNFWSLMTLVFIFMLLLVEWKQRNKEHGLDFSGLRIPGFIRHSIYIMLAGSILLFQGPRLDFIYFQF